MKETDFVRDDWFDVWGALWHLPDGVLELLEEGLNRNFKWYWNPGTSSWCTDVCVCKQDPVEKGLM